MTIFAAPGKNFVANLEDAPTGLVGTLQLGIFLHPAATVVSAYATTGITENAGGSTSDYDGVRTAPAAPAASGTDYFLQWKNGSEVVREKLVITGNGLPSVSTAILDRVKERVESDLSDGELAALITEAQEAITDRFGPDAGSGDITVTIDGGLRTLDLVRPAATITSVTEHLGSVPDAQPDDWAGEVLEDTAVTLTSSDYRIRNNGRTLERLFTGPNSRARWGTRVDVVYAPVSDQAKRDEVVVKLVALAVEYEGVSERRVGDTQAVKGARSWAAGQAPLIYSDERERLLESLRPRAGIFLR